MLEVPPPQGRLFLRLCAQRAPPYPPVAAADLQHHYWGAEGWCCRRLQLQTSRLVVGGRQKDSRGTYPGLPPCAAVLWLRVATAEQKESSEGGGGGRVQGGSAGHAAIPPALTVLLAQDGALLPQEGSPACAGPRVGSRDSGVPAGGLPQVLVVDLGGENRLQSRGQQQDSPQPPLQPTPILPHRGAPQLPPPQLLGQRCALPSPYPPRSAPYRGAAAAVQERSVSAASAARQCNG